MATGAITTETQTFAKEAIKGLTGMAGQIASLGIGHVHLSVFAGTNIPEVSAERRYVGGMAGYTYPCPEGSPDNAQTRILWLRL
jgi:hypothetical protein